MKRTNDWGDSDNYPEEAYNFQLSNAVNYKDDYWSWE